jgi:hypothetical protein
MITVDYIDDAYAAGFLEADGCIHITKNTACVRITNRNLEVLKWFEVRYGGQVRSKVVPAGCWEWNVHSDKAVLFIGQVYEYLVFKKPQADLLLEFANTRQKRGIKLPDNITNLREGINARMKKEKAQWRA